MLSGPELARRIGVLSIGFGKQQMKVVLLLLACLTECSCSASGPIHSEEDYKKSTIYSVSATIYQKTFKEDSIGTFDARRRFFDGSSQNASATIIFDSALEDPPRHCTFYIDGPDDVSDDDDPSDHKFVRPCDGRSFVTLSRWNLTFYMRAHVIKDEGTPELVVDEVRTFDKDRVHFDLGLSPDSEKADHDDDSN
jgi:hypothetical protein